jgi:glutaredoxin
MERLMTKALMLAVAAAVVAIPAAADAQYKWQTPDGRTVYSDVPPPSGVKPMNTPNPVEAPSAEASVPQVELPYELKAVNSKFPVVLYSAPDCAPCTAARQHLASRGVPFSEKSISTTSDFDAFKARGFSDNSFPALTVGREKTVGFEAGAYDRLLTAAGYPRSSKLPHGYQQAAAEPMTPPQAQKLTVNVQREAAQGPAAPARQQSSIELYRQQMQAGAAARPGDKPSMRF